MTEKKLGRTLSERKRNDILETAHRLFNQFGFNYIGIDRIILESKTAKMTFYRNYPSKENLMFACIEYEIEKLKESLLIAIEKASDEPFGRIKAIYEWHIQKNDESTNGTLLTKAVVELKNTNFDATKQQIDEYYDWKFNLISENLNNASQYLFSERTTKIFFSLLNGILLPERNTSLQHVPSWHELQDFLKKNTII
jgi:Transcriptional regulator